jgi:hypothetical protein
MSLYHMISASCFGIMLLCPEGTISPCNPSVEHLPDPRRRPSLATGSAGDSTLLMWYSLPAVAQTQVVNSAGVGCEINIRGHHHDGLKEDICGTLSTAHWFCDVCSLSDEQCRICSLVNIRSVHRSGVHTTKLLEQGPGLMHPCSRRT